MRMMAALLALGMGSRLALLTILQPRTADICCAWASVTDRADITAAMLTILKLMNDAIEIKQVDTAVQLFDRLIKKEEAGRLAKQSARWKQWVETSLTHGAGRAHRWTNMPNEQATGIVPQEGQGLAEAAAMHRDAWPRVWQGSQLKAAEVVDEMILKFRARDHGQAEL